MAGKIDINAGMVNAQPLQAGLEATDFGAGQLEKAGQAVERGIGKIAEARIRVDNRRDTINRARLKSQYADVLENEYQRRQVEGDLTDPAQVEDFQRFANEKAMEMLGSHEGSQESVGKLSVTFDGLRSNYTRQFSRDVIAAGRTLVKDNLRSGITDIVDRTATTGDIDLGFSEVDQEILDSKEALSPTEERRFGAIGKQSIVTQTFDRLMTEQNYEAAETLLNDERLSDIFADDVKGLRQMRSKLLVEKMSVDEGRKAAEKDLQELMALDPSVSTIEEARAKYGPALIEKRVGGRDKPRTLNDKWNEYVSTRKKVEPGYEATPDDFAKFTKMDSNVAEANMDFDQKVAMVETIFGADMTPAQIEQMEPALMDEQMAPSRRLGIIKGVFPDMDDEQARQVLTMDFTPDKDNERSTANERAKATLAQLSDGFALENLSPEEEKQWQNAVTSLTSVQTYTDPDTGRTIVIPSEALPNYVKEAYAQRGIEIPRPQPLENALAGDGNADVDIQNGQPSRRTLYDMAPDITGVTPTLIAGASRLPVIGDLVRSRAPIDTSKIVQARTLARTMTRQLVTVLQNNPRYAEGERLQIQNDLDLDPSLIDNVADYQDRLIAIDDTLVMLKDNAETILNSATTTRDERRQAIAERNAVDNYRLNLGAPPILNSERELEGLPEGAAWRDPNGQVRYKQRVDTDG